MIQLTERRYHGTMLVRRLSFAQAPADPHTMCLINRLWSWPLDGSLGCAIHGSKRSHRKKVPTGGQRKKALDVVYRWVCLKIG